MNLYSTSKAKLSVKIIEATLQRGSMSSSGISIGTSIAHQLDLKCTYASWMKKGVSFFFEVKKTATVVEEILYWKRFIISHIDGDREVVTITAYGPLYLFQALPFSLDALDTVSPNPASPTYRDVIAAVEHIAMTTYKNYGDIFTINFVKGTNRIRNAAANKLPAEGITQLKKYNCRQILEFCAGACGANVYDYYDIDGMTDLVSDKDSRSIILIDFPLKQGEDVSDTLYKDGLKVEANSAQAVDRLVVNTYRQTSGWSEDQTYTYTKGVSESQSMCSIEMENPIVSKQNVDLIWSILSGWAFHTSEAQLFGNIWLDETKKYYCYDGDNTVDANMIGYAPVMQVTTTIDGGMKSTWSCSGQAEQMSNQSGGSSAEKVLIQEITEQIFELYNMDIKGSRIKDSSITNSKIADSTIEGGKIADSTLTGAKIKDATIDFEKVAKSFIQKLTVDEEFVNILNAKYIKTDEFKTKIAEMETLKSTDAIIKNIFSEGIISDSAILKILQSNIVNSDVINAAVENVGFLTAKEAKIKYATIEHLDVLEEEVRKKLSTDELESRIAMLGYITSDSIATLYLKSSQAALMYADITLTNIDTANVDKETVGQLFAEIGILQNVMIKDGAVTGELNGVRINGDWIDANTLAADKLILRGKDGLFYEINATCSGLSSTELSDEKYKEAIDGTCLIKKSITAEQINVDTELVRQLFAHDVTATGTITGAVLKGATLKSANAEIDSGKVGGFDISSNRLYSNNETYSAELSPQNGVSFSYIPKTGGVIDAGKMETVRMTAKSGFSIVGGGNTTKENNSIDISLDNGVYLNYAEENYLQISNAEVKTKNGIIRGNDTTYGFLIRPESNGTGQIGHTSYRFKQGYINELHANKLKLKDSDYGIEIVTTSSGGSAGVRIGDLSGANGYYTYITNDCVAQHNLRIDGGLTVNGVITFKNKIISAITMCRTSNYTISSTTESPISLDTTKENSDTDVFNPSGGMLIIKKSGYYLISGAAVMSATGNLANVKYLRIRDTSNNNLELVSVASRGIGTWQSFIIPPMLVYLSANATLALFYQDQSGSGTVYGNKATTYMTVTRLQ